MDTYTNEQNIEMAREEHELNTPSIKIRGHLLECDEKLIQISNIQSVSYWIENEPPKPAEIDMLFKESERKKQEAIRSRDRGEELSGKLRTQLIIGAVVGAFGLIISDIWFIFSLLCMGIGGFIIHYAFQNYKEGQNLITIGNDLDQQAIQDENRANQLTRNYELLKEQAKYKKYLNLYLNSGWRYSINFGNNKPLLMKAYDCLRGIFEKGGKADITYNIDISNSKFNGQNIFAETISDSNIENTMTASDS